MAHGSIINLTFTKKAFGLIYVAVASVSAVITDKYERFNSVNSIWAVDTRVVVEIFRFISTTPFTERLRHVRWAHNI